MSSEAAATASNNNNEVLQRFYSTFERIILFFAFDFTLDWKQTIKYFNGKRRSPNNPRRSTKMEDYSKVLRKKCLHKPTVPPRSSPRKHVRGKIQSYDEPKVEAQKKSSVEMNVKVSSSSKKGGKKNGEKISQSNLEVTKVSKVQHFSPLTEETGNLSLEKNVEGNENVEDGSISNPFTVFLQPIINLWSNNDSNDDGTVFENPNNSVEIDQSTVLSDASNVYENPQSDNLQQQQDIPTMDMLEEALNESPEKFIDTLIAMNNASVNASESETINTNTAAEKTGIINESFGQQLLAEAGAQLIQYDSATVSHHSNEYSTHKQQNIGSNFCINRTTTFHLEPVATTNFPLKL